MSRFFNVENPFFTVINKLVDLIFLSIIVCFICIPAIFTGIITFTFSEGFYIIMAVLFVLATGLVGPALTALYYSVAKSVRHSRSYAVKEFFSAYKKNFLQGAVMGMVFGAFAVIMFLDFFAMKNLKDGVMSDKANTVIKSILRAFCILMGMASVYIFPMLSRFNMKVGKFFFSAFMMSIRHLFTTIILLLNAIVFGAGPVIVAYFMGATSMEQYLTICIPCYLFLPGIGCFLSSFLIEKIFKQYILKGIEDEKARAEQNGEEYVDPVEDRWYLE